MEWMLLLCAGRWREEGGFLVFYALEEGGEMECLCCYAMQGGGWKRGFLVLLCARGREGDGMCGNAMVWKAVGGSGMPGAAMRLKKEVRWNAWALCDRGWEGDRMLGAAMR
jgi:hypothetical protein